MHCSAVRWQAVAFKTAANFFLVMVFLVEILPKIDWELHVILEVLRSSWRGRAFAFPFLAFTVVLFPSFEGEALGAARASIEAPAPREACFCELLRGDLERAFLQIGNTFLQRL